MADTPMRPAVGVPSRIQAPARTLWTGTGLCCEAQGDGVPCAGPDGECEVCGRQLPDPVRDRGIDDPHDAG
jgi:hypothetical protein